MRELYQMIIVPSMTITISPMLVMVSGVLSRSRDTGIKVIRLVTTSHAYILIKFHMKTKYIFNLMKNIIRIL